MNLPPSGNKVKNGSFFEYFRFLFFFEQPFVEGNLVLLLWLLYIVV